MKRPNLRRHPLAMAIGAALFGSPMLAFALSLRAQVERESGA